MIDITIDEAIAKYKEIANTDANCPAHCNISCDKCVQESKQLAEWLEELKSYRASVFSGYMTQKMLKEEYNKAIDDVIDKLAEYEGLEEQGRLVKLPCKIGTEVYDITWWDDVQEKVVVKGKAYYRTVHKHKVTKSPFTYSDIDDFGKTVFLTKSEAEQKLKEMESD